MDKKWREITCSLDSGVDVRKAGFNISISVVRCCGDEAGSFVELCSVWRQGPFVNLWCDVRFRSWICNVASRLVRASVMWRHSPFVHQWYGVRACSCRTPFVDVLLNFRARSWKRARSYSPSQRHDFIAMSTTIRWTTQSFSEFVAWHHKPISGYVS